MYQILESVSIYSKIVPIRSDQKQFNTWDKFKSVTYTS